MDEWKMPVRNRFYGLRHGESVANVERRIVSDPAIACTQYGLTDQGKRQVAETMRRAREGGALPGLVVFFTSDFLRTVETTQIAWEVTHGLPAQIAPALRERSFGSLEGTTDGQYERVWGEDRVNAQHHVFGVESVVEVATRLVRLVTHADTQWKDVSIVLVSHGDPLNILAAVWEGRALTSHRSGRPWEPAELRRFSARM